MRTIFSITPVADDLPADVELVSRIRQLAVGEMQPAEPNLLARLTELGLEFELVEAHVRLLAPLELLDQAGIVAGLQGAASNLLSELHLFWTVDSTNTYLLRFAGAHAEQPGGQIFQGAVCLA